MTTRYPVPHGSKFIICYEKQGDEFVITPSHAIVPKDILFLIDHIVEFGITYYYAREEYYLYNDRLWRILPAHSFNGGKFFSNIEERKLISKL